MPPALTGCPPNTFTPRRFDSESRPFLVEPAPFLWAASIDTVVWRTGHTIARLLLTPCPAKALLRSPDASIVRMCCDWCKRSDCYARCVEKRRQATTRHTDKQHLATLTLLFAFLDCLLRKRRKLKPGHLNRDQSHFAVHCAQCVCLFRIGACPASPVGTGWLWFVVSNLTSMLDTRGGVAPGHQIV